MHEIVTLRRLTTMARTACLLAATLAVLAGAPTWAAAQQSPVRTSSSSSASASADTSGALPEVTVKGRRISLARRVSKFVNQIASLENAQGLPVWEKPACPFVTGLPLEEAGIILGRLSEIARAAKVPLGSEGCYPPNLFIVVTADPKGLLQGWDDGTRTRVEVFGGATEDLFAGAPRSVIEKFIATPRAVRVWYYTHEKDASGLILAPHTSIYDPPVVDHAEATHILSNHVTYDFFRVFVIADQVRLHGLTIGQLADYVSMVGFAKLEPDARLGNAPSILRLFDEPTQTVPSGLTDWDQAFLKALYATDRRSKLQRGQISRAMVRQIGR